MLGAPLLSKIVVADLLINLGAFLVMRDVRDEWAGEVMVAALLVTLVLNAGLVYWALLPLRVLETTARRVSAGDLDARVRMPPLADRNLARIGATLNALLDGVTADRRRMRALATQVISAGDQERAHIARELHDSTAQSLTALEMLTTTTLRELPAGPLHERLGVMRDVVVETLREVRTLSHNVHPRVLDDLGLVAALEFLARRTREQLGAPAGAAGTPGAPDAPDAPDVRVESDVRGEIPLPVASVIYRVAQEAVRNAVRHAGATQLRLTLGADGQRATLEVGDDGRGFDPVAAQAARTGMGLFVMRERLALIDGQLELDSRPGRGTVVRAWAPLVASSVPAAPRAADLTTTREDG